MKFEFIITPIFLAESAFGIVQGLQRGRIALSNTWMKSYSDQSRHCLVETPGVQPVFLTQARASRISSAAYVQGVTSDICSYWTSVFCFHWPAKKRMGSLVILRCEVMQNTIHVWEIMSGKPYPLSLIQSLIHAESHYRHHFRRGCQTITSSYKNQVFKYFYTAFFYPQICDFVIFWIAK